LNVDIAMAKPDLISRVYLSSFVIMQPKYLKYSTLFYRNLYGGLLP